MYKNDKKSPARTGATWPQLIDRFDRKSLLFHRGLLVAVVLNHLVV